MKYIYDNKLKDILINTKSISKDLLNTYKTSNGISFIEFLLKEDIVSFELMSEILFNHFSTKSYKLYLDSISSDAITKFDYNIASKYSFLPFLLEGDKIHIAMANPFNDQAYEDIKLISNSKIEVYFANPTEIRFFINHFYNMNNIDTIVEEFKSKSIVQGVDNYPIVKIINSILDSATLVGASDIHIEPLEKNLRIRFRIDGVLKEHQTIDKNLFSNIVSRLKIMAGLDISISRYPQDGHFKEEHCIQNVDFRLSTLPTIFGEKIVIRIVYKKGLIFDLNGENLDFFEEDIEEIKLLLENNHGAILVTGPTGSGKSTTVSSFISYLNKEEVNIITIEDPVENVIEGVIQVNVDNKINLDFHNVLRSILRQDPDIIMIGEIRDRETANIAIRAAITGHLVFATLHTNGAVSSISRLIDLGIEDYFISEAIKGIISQQLVRKLCNYCKKKIEISEKFAVILNIEKSSYIYESTGCRECFYTGYKGRFAIYEILTMDSKIKSFIESKASFENIKEVLEEDGMSTIKDSAIRHLLNGNTSLEEIFKVLHGIL